MARSFPHERVRRPDISFRVRLCFVDRGMALKWLQIPFQAPKKQSTTPHGLANTPYPADFKVSVV